MKQSFGPRYFYRNLQGIPLVCKPIAHRVDKASATETIDLGLISGRVKPKATNIAIHSFPALTFSIKKESVKLPPPVVDRWQLDGDRMVPSLSTGRDIVNNKRCNYNCAKQATEFGMTFCICST